MDSACESVGAETWLMSGCWPLFFSKLQSFGCCYANCGMCRHRPNLAEKQLLVTDTTKPKPINWPTCLYTHMWSLWSLRGYLWTFIVKFVLSTSGHNSPALLLTLPNPPGWLGAELVTPPGGGFAKVVAEFAWIDIWLSFAFICSVVTTVGLGGIPQTRKLGALDNGLGGEYHPMHTKMYCLPLLELIWVYFILWAIYGYVSFADLVSDHFTGTLTDKATADKI